MQEDPLEDDQRVPCLVASMCEVRLLLLWPRFPVFALSPKGIILETRKSFRSSVSLKYEFSKFTRWLKYYTHNFRAKFCTQRNVNSINESDPSVMLCLTMKTK